MKRIVAMLLCLTAALTFSACNSDDSSSETSEAETEEATKETEIVYEVDTTEAQETSVTLSDGVLETSYYTVEFGDDWSLTTGSDELILLAGITDSSMSISAVYSSDYAGLSSDEFAESFKVQYDEVEGYDVLSSEVQTFGENEVGTLVVSMTISESTDTQKQYFIADENGGVIITYLSSADTFDDSVTAIDDAISTFAFK
ncbi:MAG: hypothetical protein LUH57_05155 [Ruminococcus sp.]|nr:hypothetical protein [Ruminococcus sp.]